MQSDSHTRAAPLDMLTLAVSSMMTFFESVSEADVRRVIMASHFKSLSFTSNKVLGDLLPYITALVNASLTQGRLLTACR